MQRLGGILSLLGLGLLAGGMLFFGAVMAPLVFTRLPLDVAGPFIRTAFPFYYAYILATSGLALVGFLLRRLAFSALVPGGTFAATIWAWFWLIPRLDAYRAAGNMAAFNHGHTLSVWVDGIELLAVLTLLIREGAKRG